MPAARLANGARSPPRFHVNGIQGPTPDMQKKEDLDSPVMITSGKFSPPPCLFEGLRNPFSETWCSDTSKEDATSLNSIGLKELSKASTLERHVNGKTDSLNDEFDDDDEEDILWPVPPPMQTIDTNKQKAILAPKPPVPPKPPSTTPYAVPNIVPGTSTLTRKTHRSQYAQPSIQAVNSDSSNVTEGTNGVSIPISGDSMLLEIEKTYNENKVNSSNGIPESSYTYCGTSPPLPPTNPPPELPSKLLVNQTSQPPPEPPPEPPPPPPLPPVNLPISPLSSPPDSAGSSSQLSPPSSPSDSPPSSSPNSPPHFLLNWR